MSPALVDPFTPAASAAGPVKRTPPSPRNPRIVGETLQDVAPSAIPSSPDRLRTPTATMDPTGAAQGNSGERNLESVFSMLFPPPKADRAPPAPSPGLSKPRFLKVRRHFTSPRVRPGPAAFADSEDVSDPGFNPFRCVPPPTGDASDAVRATAAGTDRSSFGGFVSSEADGAEFTFGKPMNSDRGGIAIASANDSGFTFTLGGHGDSGCSKPVESDNTKFVFSAGPSTTGSSEPSHLTSSIAGDGGNTVRRSATSRSWSSASEETVPSATCDLGMGAKSSYIDETAAKSVKDKEEGVFSSSGVFLFGSGSKKSVVSDRSDAGFDKSAAGNLPDKMQNLNIRGSRNADNTGKFKAGAHGSEASDGSSFVFGANTNLSASYSESNFPAGGFVFGSSLNKCSAPDLGYTDCCDKSSVGELPGEIQKLNIKDSATENWSTNSVNASHKFTTIGSCSSGAETVPTSSMFDFGRTAKHSNSEQNIDATTGLNGCEKMKGPNYRSEVDPKEIFIFGTSQNIGSSCENYTSELPDELKTLNTGRGTTHQPESRNETGTTSSAGIFVFSCNSKKSIDPDQNAVDGFDKSATGKLSEEMQRLNVRDSRNAGSFGKGKGENDSLDSNSGGFVFGSSKNTSGSVDEGNYATGAFVFESNFSRKSSVPDLNVFDGSDKSSVSNNSDTSLSGSNNNVSGSFGESKHSTACFVSGSSSTQGTDPCRSTFESFFQREFNKLPDEMQKLNIRVSANSSCWEKSKSSSYTTGNNNFVLGSKNDASASSGEANSASGVFVFGSSSNKSTVYHEGTADWFEKGTNLPDEMQKLNIRGYMDDDSCEKNESDDYKPMAHDSDAFVSAGDKNVPSSSSNDYCTTSTSTSPQFSFHTTDCGGSSGVGGVTPPPTDCYARPVADTNTSSCPSSFGSISQSSGYDSTLPSHCEGLGTPQMNFKATKQDSSLYSKDSFVQCQNTAFNVKNGVLSHLRSKKRRGKLRDSATHFQRGGKEFISREKGSQVNSELDSTGDYSPMDFSPCQLETLVTEGCCREASVVSGESIDFSSCHSSTEVQNSISVGPKDEDLIHATECFDVNEEYHKHEQRELHDGDTRACTETGFTFAATPSTYGSFTASKHIHRRKFRTKVGRDSYISNPDANVHFSSPSEQLFPDASNSSQVDPSKAQTGVPSVSQCLEGNRLEVNKKPEVRPEIISMAEASIAAQEACEKWRLRGNQAYANGDLSRAEEYYTHGVNSISPDETSGSCTRALMLCYSNRAATRMSIGRIREALCDCVMAAAIDPCFLRAQLRAANCHLLLGEIEDACSYFKKCLSKGSELCVDHKFILEASDGLAKAKQAADYMEHATALLQRRTTNDATSAMQIILDALSLCPYSESLIEMKAEALLTLRRYDELIEFCNQTLETAALNSSLPSGSDQFKEGVNSSRSQMSPPRAWRFYLKSRAYFFLGRLEESLSLLQEQERVEGIADRCVEKSETVTVLFATVHELLRLKIAGNTAFKSGRHSEAVEHYTAALTYNIESRPFAAVCFCNRAAAYQALGQITDAISDCSLAIALDPNYPKAISRRATLLEMIRDYNEASNDLHRLVSLLERRLDDKSEGTRATGNGDDPELARLRLAKLEEKARKEIPLDMYMILGIETSSDSAEIKKAYRKAALRHHPDKAGQFLVRSDNANEGLWKEVADEVHRDADHLFKIIGEAYAVLSDQSKRLQYDTEEEIRTSQKCNSGASTPRTQPDFHSSHFEKSSRRWQSRDHWKSYGSSNQRWSGSYRTNRYY